MCKVRLSVMTSTMLVEWIPVQVCRPVYSDFTLTNTTGAGGKKWVNASEFVPVTMTHCVITSHSSLLFSSRSLSLRLVAGSSCENVWNLRNVFATNSLSTGSPKLRTYYEYMTYTINDISIDAQTDICSLVCLSCFCHVVMATNRLSANVVTPTHSCTVFSSSCRWTGKILSFNFF